MRQFDSKNREFYDDLTPEEKKKFSNYLMIRWGATVTGDRDLEEYYILSANEKLNRHFFDVNRHPKLQWLMSTAVSPKVGSQKHSYPKFKAKEAADNQVKKTLSKLYPTAKPDDIEVYSKLITKKQLKELMHQYGNSAKD
mgnify:CR=1 FL=1